MGANSPLEELLADGIHEPLVSATPDPRWERLRALGTELWLDTGDMDQAAALWNDAFTALTTNNTLLNREIQKGIYDAWIPAAASAARASRPDLGDEDLVLEIAFALNARHGLRLAARFGARVSVELHTALADDVDRSVAYGLRYAAVSDRFIVKVPLTPAGLVAARRLEEAGVPVNFTLGFSARQNALIASVARPHFCNVFLGRLNAYAQTEGLSDGRWVGERVTMASQAAVRERRATLGAPTRQIAASMRSGEQVATLAGSDVYTMPVAVARGFLDEGGGELADRTGEDYLPNWGEEVATRIEGVDALWTVEPGFLQTCDRLAAVPVEALEPQAIVTALHEAGYGSVFPMLSDDDHARLRAEGKAPRRDSWLSRVAAGETGLDALFTAAGLHAFAEDQAALDARIRQHLS
jgi:transaldolase